MLQQVRPYASADGAWELRVKGLCKRFGAAQVLADINLEVMKGELITVLGPSGSGKTTLLRLLCGFDRADGGCIELGGRTVARGRELHLPPERRGLGYVAQEGALFPHLSVQENLLFGLPRRTRKARRREKARRIGELLDLVGLPINYAERKPAALSGGEQQRVALARALAQEPAIVLLDEPFSALDAGLRAGLRAAIASSLKRAHATALLVTHDQGEALSVGDRVAVLQDGRLGQVDSPQRLYHFPVNREIAGFVGEAVMVPGLAMDGMVECCFGILPIAPEIRMGTNGPVEVMIRPEQFQLRPDRAAPNGNGMAPQRARVAHVQFYGHDAQLTLHMNEHCRFTATVPGFGVPAFGQDIDFTVTGNVVVYPRGEESHGQRARQHSAGRKGGRTGNRGVAGGQVV